MGAFLVSAEMKGGRVAWVEIRSEAGGEVKVVNPWKGAVCVARKGKAETVSGETLTIATRRGEMILLRAAE